MSKKKGLSLEEKRTRMLELLHDKKQCYQLKELEKIAPKEKGITSMSVKDVVQSLVDDGLIDTERIGTSNYFWSFPSKAANINRKRLRDLEGRLTEVAQKRACLADQLSAARVGREESEERTRLLTELQQRREVKTKLVKELQEYKSCDPQHMAKLKQQTSVATEAANRWTENVFAVKQWCKSKFAFEEDQLNKQFGIPEEFDYL